MDNIPAEKEQETGDNGDGRRGEALRSLKKIRVGESEEKESKNEGGKQQKVRRKVKIYNVQTEGGPLRDQYLEGNREEKEEEGEQTEVEDESMSEVASTKKEGEDEEKEQNPGKIQRQTGNRTERIKAKRDANRLMNFGPYRRGNYGEVLRKDPEYVKKLIKENQRDNQKEIFARWVMAFIAETFFTEEEKEQEEELEEDKPQEKEEGRRKKCQI